LELQKSHISSWRRRKTPIFGRKSCLRRQNRSLLGKISRVSCPRMKNMLKPRLPTKKRVPPPPHLALKLPLQASILLKWRKKRFPYKTRICQILCPNE